MSQSTTQGHDEFDGHDSDCSENLTKGLPKDSDRWPFRGRWVRRGELSVPDLMTRLKNNPNEQTRLNAVMELCAAGEDPEVPGHDRNAILPAFLMALRFDRCCRVRGEVVRYFHKHGRHGYGAYDCTVPAVANARFECTDLDFRRDCDECLNYILRLDSKLGTRDYLRDALERELSHNKDSWIRWDAAKALRCHGQGYPALMLANVLNNDSDTYVRRAAAEALDWNLRDLDAGVWYKEVKPQVVKCAFHHEDPTSQEAAHKVLDKWDEWGWRGQPLSVSSSRGAVAKAARLRNERELVARNERLAAYFKAHPL